MNLYYKSSFILLNGFATHNILASFGLFFRLLLNFVLIVLKGALRKALHPLLFSKYFSMFLLV